MQLLMDTGKSAGNAASFWRSPGSWLREKSLGRSFWVFFTAAFFFDAGFSVYFFLFNLYLLDYHFNERMIGWVNGALTLGSVVGTLPAGAFARRFGLRPLLMLCFLAAPLAGVMRALWVWEPAQVALAFLGGLAMCTWGVSFLPAVARLTTERNRTSAFSLIFSVSIGTSALGGIICGYLPRWLELSGVAMRAAEVKRLILLASCGIALVGLVAVLRLRLPAPAAEDQITQVEAIGSWLRVCKFTPFLTRFLPLMALWSAVIAAFAPFANVYLSRDLHVPLVRIGLIFSIVQAVQLCMGLLTPLVVRGLGLVKSIVVMQASAAVALSLMALAHAPGLAICLYLTFSAAQWMSSPGLYNLLMTETADEERSPVAAMTLFCNALAGAGATALAGVLFTNFGYRPVLLGIAALAFTLAIVFRVVIRLPERPSKKEWMSA